MLVFHLFRSSETFFKSDFERLRPKELIFVHFLFAPRFFFHWAQARNF